MNKYIIYQGSGGLIHLLGGLVYCCEYIKDKKNFKLIIDVKNHKGFGIKFDKYFKLVDINYSEDYNDIKDINSFYNIPLEEFSKKNVDYDPDRGYYFDYNNISINLAKSFKNYNNFENLMTYVGHGGNNRFNILKYVKCNKDFIRVLNEKYKLNKRYIGVHFRNTDRKNDIKMYYERLKIYIDYKIYIATDDYKAIDIFKKELLGRNIEIIYYNKPFNANGENIHFNDPDKDNMIRSILIDMFMLYHCEIFIDSPNSLVSKLVNYMRKENKSIFD